MRSEELRFALPVGCERVSSHTDFGEPGCVSPRNTRAKARFFILRTSSATRNGFRLRKKGRVGLVEA